MIQINKKKNYFVVENSFVDKYLCEANGSFVKVYLYTLRHAEEDGITLAGIASALNLLESDVVRAFKYWHKEDVVKFEQHSNGEYCIDFLDISADETEKEAKADTASELRASMPHTAVMYTKSDINNYMKNNDGIRHMFLISSQLLNRVLSDNDRKILFSFYDYLKMPVEVIFTLLEYCASIGKTNMRYIERVAYSWADSGIDTLSKASAFVKEKTEYNALTKKYKEMFKITGRDFTDTEEQLLKSWIYDLKADDDAIKNAYEATVANTGKIAFKYMDAILRNSSSDSSQRGSAPAKKSTVRKKNSFQNYDSEITDFDLEIMKNRISKTANGGEV